MKMAIIAPAPPTRKWKIHRQRRFDPCKRNTDRSRRTRGRMDRWKLKQKQQVRSDNDASKLDILGHFGTFRDNSENFLTSLGHSDYFPSPFRPFSPIIILKFVHCTTLSVWIQTNHIQVIEKQTRSGLTDGSRDGRTDGRTDGQTLL